MSGFTLNPGSHQYSVYGVAIRSAWPLAFPLSSSRSSRVAEVDFVDATDEDFADIDAPPDRDQSWFQAQTFADGSTYVRWSDLYEFRIPADGARVACRPLTGGDRGVLQNFLFGPALSFALVRQGIEPLHAAVAQVGDAAVGFLGDCTFGKSTLLAAFLHAGHRVLTDDLLVVERHGDVPIALPGSGRIKLLPDSASAFMGDGACGTPLNRRTTKLSFALDNAQLQEAGLPLTHLFALPTPEQRDAATSIEILPLSRTEIVQELIKNTFNIESLDRERLLRQFSFVTGLASDVRGCALRYPSGLQYVPLVRARILEHVSASVDGSGVTDIFARRH
jgi:hypothetical protein